MRRCKSSYARTGTNHVRPTIRIIARALFRAGGLGLLTLGAFDSSPLVVPLGNDLLVLALSARYHDRMLYYAVMATLGSLIGCFATVWISRKGGARLKKVASSEHLGKIQKQVQKRAGWHACGGVAPAAAVSFYGDCGGCGGVQVSAEETLQFCGRGKIRALRDRGRAGDSLRALDHPAGEIANARRRDDRAHRDFDRRERHFHLPVERKKQADGPTGGVTIE